MPINSKQLFNPDFRFREKELDIIRNSLHQRGSILLTGIRRTGKSDLQREALYQYTLKGGKVGFLNVQDYTSLHDFYRDILREMPSSIITSSLKVLKSTTNIPSQLVEWLKSQIAEVNIANIGEIKFQAPTSLVRYWQPLTEAICTALAKHSADEIPVLGIDELPFLLENLIIAKVPDEELRVALASLRKLRDSGLRMIIAGSISMENLLSLHGIPDTVLGGLFRLPIHPFSEAEARSFLLELLENKSACDSSVIETTLEKLPDFIPEFLKIAALHLHTLKKSSDVTLILENDILPSIRRSFLTQFDERLERNYPSAELKIAVEILDNIAASGLTGHRLEGKTLPEGYRRVVRKLQYDNFIYIGKNYQWVFSLQLLRNWWRAERGIK